MKLRSVVGGSPAQILATCTFLTLFLAHALCVTVFERGWNTPNPPWYPEFYRPIEGFCLLSWVVVATFVGYRLLRAWMPRPRPYWQWAGRACLALLVFVTGMNYFHGSKLSRPTHHHYNDTYHYALGSKYFAELGYTHLYRCTIQSVGRSVIADAAKARSLDDYRMTTAGEYRSTGPDCRELFTDERWQGFQRDVETYRTPDPELRRLRSSITDHGYNGTPAQTFVSSHLASLSTLTPEFLLGFTLFDVALICVVLAAIVRTFGWQWGGFVALFFFTNFVDRNDITGASFVRQLWMAGLGLGLCALRLRRPATAAALLVTAAAFNVFPAVFWAGAAVYALWGIVRARALTRWARRFALGTVLSTAVLLPMGAAHGHGFDNYALFAADMATHTGNPRLADGRKGIRQSSFGIGMRYLFIQKHERNADGKSVKLSRPERLKRYEDIRWLHWATAGVLLLATGWLVRRMDAVQATLILGFALMFSLLDTAFYYFTWTSLLPLVFTRARAPELARSMMGGLLAFSAAANTYRVLPNYKSAPLHNEVATMGFLVFLLLLLVYVAVPGGSGAGVRHRGD